MDGSQPFSVLMNEQVSNLLPPKLTSQINAGAIWARVCSLLCELAVSELREIRLKKICRAAGSMWWSDKIARITVEWQLRP